METEILLHRRLPLVAHPQAAHLLRRRQGDVHQTGLVSETRLLQEAGFLFQHDGAQQPQTHRNVTIYGFPTRDNCHLSE